MDTERIKKAISDALSSRGKYKGYLKAKCPPVDTDAAAAWQAIMGYANPYKTGLGHIMFMSKERHDNVYRPIVNTIEYARIDCRSFDRDKVLSIL